MALLEAGTVAPDFTVQTHTGETCTLSKIGKPVVLWFYPEADTPG
jgi:peroxiredoxin Q/BCP